MSPTILQKGTTLQITSTGCWPSNINRVSEAQVTVPMMHGKPYTQPVVVQVSDHGGILEDLQQQLACAEQLQAAERDSAKMQYAELEKALLSAEQHLAHDQHQAAELQCRLDEASSKLEVSTWLCINQICLLLVATPRDLNTTSIDRQYPKS